MYVHTLESEVSMSMSSLALSGPSCFGVKVRERERVCEGGMCPEGG